eukprot:1806576-Amphidinium_carterae.1
MRQPLRTQQPCFLSFAVLLKMGIRRLPVHGAAVQSIKQWQSYVFELAMSSELYVCQSTAHDVLSSVLVPERS